jgi:hypothetical protein
VGRGVRRVFLGDSLTSNLLAREGDLVVDFWEGGSDLYGWSIGSYCVDRVPVFLRRSCCTGNLRWDLLEVDVSVSVEGLESIVGEKLGDLGTTVVGLSGRLYIPVKPVCSYFRRLRSESKAQRLYSPIVRVDLELREVVTYHARVEFSELVNTLPLHYLLMKSGLKDLAGGLKYSSAHVLMLVAETPLREYSKLFIGHRGYLTGCVISYLEEPLGRVLYAITPLTGGPYREDLTAKVMGELKRLKVVSGQPRSYRSFYLKYFRFHGDPRRALEELRKYGVLSLGRYGSWSELDLCTICGNVG